MNEEKQEIESSMEESADLTEIEELQLEEPDAEENASGEVEAEMEAAERAKVDSAEINFPAEDIQPEEDSTVMELPGEISEIEEDWPEEILLSDESSASEGQDETIRIIASDETVAESNAEQSAESIGETVAIAEEQITATHEELKPAIESLLFVADEPLPFKQLCKALGEVPESDVLTALQELAADYEARNSGLEVREIAGGWRISTRPQNHEFIRKYLKSRPSARLSLPALETLAVIAYKQPITIPEILEIRGVSSSSAIKTLLEKRLIVTKGRKETVGRPMMYGTSKEFLIQFGLKDLTELPSIEDFEDLAQ